MATTINGTTGKNSSHWRYFLVCNEQDVSASSNTSKLKVDVYLGATSYSRAVRGNISATHTINVNGKNYSFTTGAYTIEKNTNYLLGTIITDPIEHNADGSKTVSVSASSPDLPQASGYGPYSGSASGTVTLTTIARYANLTSLSVASKTINSITLNYTTDRNAWLFAKLNDGEWLNSGEPFASDTTSGSFTIYYKDRASTTRLDPNTKYKITILCRALDRNSGLDTQKDIEVTTYDIAKLVSVPDINIGSKQTITWTNPSGATTTLKLAKTDNTQIANIGTVTGTSKDYTPTASTIYALTPNSNEYIARYIITTTANSQSYTNAKDFKFKVTNSNPTFTTYTYKNTNTTSYNGGTLDTLTGSNQILVKGYSNVQVDITTANKAIAKNSATMSTYKLVLGSKSQMKDYSSSATVSLTANAIDSNVMTVYATDSRGNSTSVAKTLSSSNYKQYTEPVIKSVTATRSDNGVGKGVTLKYNGTFWNASFGSVTNTIGSVTYQYKETSSSTWSSAVALTPTISSSNYSGSISIQGDLGAEGFNVAKSYNIRLIVKDKLATKTYDIVLGSGPPAVAIDKDNVAIGQKYDTSKGSKLQVNGNIYTSGYINKALADANGADISLNYSKAGTPTGNFENVQSGGALYRSGLYSINVNSNWYNLINIRHRNGQGYGTSFGMQIQTILTSNRPKINIRNQSGNTWGSWEEISRFKNLYNNTSGTTGTVTLSETAANFSYLEIFYRDQLSTPEYASVKVYSPNGKQINLSIPTSNTNVNGFWIKQKTININETSISNQWNCEIDVVNGIVSNSNYIYIIRVDGYR